MHQRTRHHLTPKCHYRGGYKPAINSPENILLIYRDKHDAWHRLFKEATLEEVIGLLTRVARMKKRRWT